MRFFTRTTIFLTALLGLASVFYGVVPATPALAQSNQCIQTTDCSVGSSCINGSCVADSFGVADINETTSLGTGDLRQTIGRIIQTVLGLVGVIAVGIVLYGGFTYMTAGGSEEKVGTAKKIIINGVIGLGIVMSSFAITTFVLSNLSNATGSGNVPTLGSGTSKSGSGGGSACSSGSVFCYAGGGSGNGGASCEEENDIFALIGLTPNQDKTNMNNVIIRAIFSEGVQTAPENVLQITQGGKLVSKDMFTYRYAPNSDRKVLEVEYKSKDDCKNETKPVGCFPESNLIYGIKLQDGITSLSGKSLDQDQASGSCSNSFGNVANTLASFAVNSSNFDSNPPSLTVAVKSSLGTSSEEKVTISKNDSFTVSSKTKDESGIGYLHIQLYDPTDSLNPLIDTFVSPKKSETEFSYDVSYGVGDEAGDTSYVLSVTAVDLDSNKQTIARTLIVTSEKKEGEDTGNEGASCTSQTQCSSNLKCIDNSCQKAPKITDISPKQGGAGTWVTVSGVYFGQNIGKVEFGLVNNESITWREVTPVVCDGGSKWSDTSILVQVPTDTDLPEGKYAAIRVTSKSGLSDATNDEYGPKTLDAQNKATGQFLKTNEQLPNLCAVKTETGLTTGEKGDKILAFGNNFGATQGTLVFGGYDSNPTSWKATEVGGVIPQNLLGGTISVAVKIPIGDGKFKTSNGVPFTIISDATAQVQSAKTEILSLSPEKVTPGSFLTISGTGFGLKKGKVYLTTDPTVQCAGSQGCILLQDPSGACAETWTDKQIVAQLPDKTSYNNSASYYIQVLAYPALAGSPVTLSSGTISVENGTPLPSLCAISPAKGPAPSPEGHTITLTGANFSADPTVLFYTAKADLKDYAKGWLSVTKTGKNAAGVPYISTANNSTIQTQIPIGTEGDLQGVTLKSGSILVKSKDGKFSNPVTYIVSDCRNASNDEKITMTSQGYHCCEGNGLDVGQWKPDVYSCAGESRVAGYAWRFSSGKLPTIPAVVEDLTCSGTFPASPAPWSARSGGETVCTTADATLRFSTHVDPKTVSPSTVKVRKCVGDTVDSCESKDAEYVQLSAGDLVVTEQKGESVLMINLPTLKDTSWYRVELYGGNSGIASKQTITLVGQEQEISVPLKATRTCNSDTAAYCFTFKSASSVCTITSADIVPVEVTASLLGVIQHPAYGIDENTKNPQHPMYFSVLGKTKDACISMNVDGLGWKWSTQSSVLSVETKPDFKKFIYDSRAVASIASFFTEPQKIFATLSPDSAITVDPKDEQRYVTAGLLKKSISDTITSSSTISFDAGTPKTTSYGPTCQESCTNAQITAVFSRQMDPTTYGSGFSVAECTDGAICSKTTNLGSYKVDGQLSSMTKLVASISKDATLKPNTYYKVSLSKDIKSLIDIDLGKQGEGLEPISWLFKTQNDANPCSVSSVILEPKEYQASTIGEKRVYVAKAMTAPNACNTQGQQINSWDYSYAWSSSDAEVASVSAYPGILSSKLSQSCGINCLPNGSTIKLAGKDAPVCGNGKVEAGEDCDIGDSGEKVGISCTVQCLRPGNTASSCGNGKLEPELGELCDPKDEATKAFCTESCLVTGSGAFNPGNPGPVCGDGILDQGETCDTGISENTPEGKTNCTNSCLHTGTKLGAVWCDAQQTKPAACANAISVCGNGIIESGESCEVTAQGLYVAGYTGVFKAGADLSGYCNSSCLLTNACALENDFKQKHSGKIPAGAPWCDPKEDGCSSSCLPLGSSLSYDAPSICGDGIVGVGETTMCEINAKSGVGVGPVQLVTVQGKKNVGAALQKTVITAVLEPNKNNLKATSELTLACAYQEYANSAIVDGRSNDCPNAKDGVASNSCCYARPKRVAQFPTPLAGIDSSIAAVCRNTAIDITIDADLQESSVKKDTVLLLEGYASANVNCGEGNKNKTELINEILAQAPTEPGFFAKIFTKVKDFVSSIFFETVDADTVPASVKDVKTWCVSKVEYSVDTLPKYDPVSKATSTQIMITTDDALAGNTLYAVALVGGNAGIRDVYGVGFSSGDTFAGTHNDMFVFKTKDEICKLESISVEPEGYLYTKPKQTKEFSVAALTKEGQKIISTASYTFEWSWLPAENAVFDISKSTKPLADISSKDVQGELSAVVKATVTNDVSATNNHKGKAFTDSTELVSSFCNNPWPAYSKDNTWLPYSDGDIEKFNVSMKYCADSGVEGTKADDLPFITSVVDLLKAEKNENNGDILVKKIFLNDKNSDAIGLQIFKNEDRLTASEWYASEFPENPPLQPITIGGYNAVTDGQRFFIDVLNVDKTTGNVYSNIYLFTLSTGSKPETGTALERIMANIEFNTNLTNFGYCLATGTVPKDALPSKDQDLAKITSVFCASDFDCREANGSEKTGTNGVCSNEKDKFLRDWKRLQDAKLIQDNLESYKKASGEYPRFDGGSYLPRYTMSKWANSWGLLSAKIGGAPVDPINNWTTCDSGDQETCWSVDDSKFSCPAYTSIYEYEHATTTSDYVLHIPFEFFNKNSSQFLSNVIAQFIPKKDALSFDQKCVSNQTYSPFGGACGDGIVQPGEDCDGANAQFVEQCNAPGQYRIWSCTDKCTWNKNTQCTTGGVCGNGIVEGAETCDDGDKNGNYGQCNKQCTGPSAEYCGDGVIQPGVEICDPKAQGFSSYALKKEQSCSLTCLGTGAYCGDGIVNGSETCDDGNGVSGDGCSNVCQAENLSCMQQKPQYHLVNEDNNAGLKTYFYLSRIANATRTKIVTAIDSVNGHEILDKSANMDSYTEDVTILQCLNGTTGKQVCAGAGLTCAQVYEFKGASYESVDSDPEDACINDLTDYIAKSGTTIIVSCNGAYQPQSDQVLYSSLSGCGNGIVESGEACDQGLSLNGKACVPGYGKSCTYCSADCKNVFTKEPDSFCGDKIVDTAAGEVCDFSGLINSQTKVYLPTSEDGGKFSYVTDASTGITCADKNAATDAEKKFWRGTYQCLAQCKQLENNGCVLCGEKNGGALPSVSIINPLVSGTFDGSKYYTDVKEDTLRLFRYGEYPGDGNRVGYLGNVALAINKNLTAKTQYTKDNGSSFGLETNAKCTDSYMSIFFVNQTKPDNNKSAESYNGTVGQGRADAFELPVKNESGNVSHEIIMSPAVPKHELRVVISYDKAKNSNVSFVGGYFYGTNAYKYANAITDNQLCTDMELTPASIFLPPFASYWVPSGSTCKPSKGGVYVQKTTGNSQREVQAFTFTAFEFKTNSDYYAAPEEFAFVVQSLNGPIAQYMDSGVTVEVYEYHEGQNLQYSIYKPTQTFDIRNSEGTSSNALAKYWQPFNIKRNAGGSFTIVPVNSLESTECGVKQNTATLPTSQCNQ